MMTEMWQLKQRLALPLQLKVEMSKRRIKEWYDSYNGEVYVAFSGGKDSTVLLDLVRSIYPNVPALFVDTGLEYPEIRQFVKKFTNVTTFRPKKNFTTVIKEEGYPLISKKVARQIRELKNPKESNKATRKLYFEGIKKDGTKTKSFKLSKKWHFLIDSPFKMSEKCCDIMKKEPIRRYVKETKRKAFVGTMASDSQQRESGYLITGCFNHKKGICLPIAFWTEKDIWDYIKQSNLPYCPIYDTGVKRTGCVFCMFGVHLEKHPNRFELLEKTHPQLHKYCIEKLELGKVLDFVKVKYQEDKQQTKIETTEKVREMKE